MAERDTGDSSMAERLRGSNFRIAEDVIFYRDMLREYLEDFEYDVTRLPQVRLLQIVQVLEEQFRQDFDDAEGLYCGRPLACSGYGAYMLENKSGQRVDGKILGGNDKLFGEVHDIRAMKVPVWPSVLGEGSGNWTHKEVLSPCIVLKWPNVYNRFQKDATDISELYAIIPLEYEGIEFEAVI